MTQYEVSDDSTTLFLTHVLLYGEGEPCDIEINDGRIVSILPSDGVATESAKHLGTVIDGRGLIVLPGLVDMHVHLREPGREDTETIATGSAAAARGGFTAVCAMPNTTPAIDTPFLAEAVWEQGRAIGLCDVHPVGAISQGLEGKILTEFGLMKRCRAHVTMFSDDGQCVANSLLMRRAMEYAAGQDVLLAQHCEDTRLTQGAIAHEGAIAGELGLTGWPRVAEESIVARDVLLARDYGARLHICHVSTHGSVELIRWAKSQGISVTAEVTPHHLLLTDERLRTFDGVNRVNPPLREEHDTHALQEALLAGTIDCVATDHAPHSAEETRVEFADAKNGMLGLETSLAIIHELFVRTGRADWRWVARVMSERPARIVGLPEQGRAIAVGEPANLTLVDPDAPWVVYGAQLASKSDNTPYEGMTFHARVRYTILRGRITHAEPIGTVQG